MNSDDFKALLRSAGQRSTPPRLAVLQTLFDAGTPLSHGELVERLVPQGYDQATLFRNLIDLTDAQLLSRIDVGDHTWRFELKNAHPHFVCTDCGDVSCLTEVDIQVSNENAKIKLGNISEVLLKGHCGDCGDQP